MHNSFVAAANSSADVNESNTIGTERSGTFAQIDLGISDAPILAWAVVVWRGAVVVWRRDALLTLRTDVTCPDTLSALTTLCKSLRIKRGGLGGIYPRTAVEMGGLADQASIRRRGRCIDGNRRIGGHRNLLYAVFALTSRNPMDASHTACFCRGIVLFTYGSSPESADNSGA